MWLSQNVALTQEQWDFIKGTLAYTRQTMETMVADFSKFKEEQDRLIAKVDGLVSTVLAAVDELDETHDSVRTMAATIAEMKLDKLDQAALDDAALKMHSLADDIGSSADMLHARVVQHAPEEVAKDEPITDAPGTSPLPELVEVAPAPAPEAPVEQPAMVDAVELPVEATPPAPEAAIEPSVEATPNGASEDTVAVQADAPALDLAADASPVATEPEASVAPEASPAAVLVQADAVELPVAEAPLADAPVSDGTALPVEDAGTEAAPETPAEVKPE